MLIHSALGKLRNQTGVSHRAASLLVSPLLRVPPKLTALFHLRSRSRPSAIARRRCQPHHRPTNHLAAAIRSFKGIDIALFSAGGSISKKFCGPAAAAGAIVIDNRCAIPPCVWGQHCVCRAPASAATAPRVQAPMARCQ